MSNSKPCKTPDGKFNMSCDPTPEVIERMVVWAQTRQRALDDARAAATVAEPPALVYYIEANLLPEAMDDGKPGVANDMLPRVNPALLHHQGSMPPRLHATE